MTRPVGAGPDGALNAPLQTFNVLKGAFRAWLLCRGAGEGAA
jgi:hypothetical protein